MLDHPRAIQLQQLANVVINAYIGRDERFKPEFGTTTKAVFHITRPEGGDPKLQVGYWYERDDFEPEERS
jgi:hypothetical protein